MSQDPIDRYVTRLGHALDLPRAVRRRVLQETEAHLRETAAALAADGLASDEAAKAAVERFGEVGEIARQIEDDRPPRSLPRRSLLVVALAGAFAVAGVAVAVTGSDTPYGIVVSAGPQQTNGLTQGGQAYAVRLDPRTLKPAPGRRVALGSFTSVMAYDPTLKLAAVTHQNYDNMVRLVDLAALKRVRDLRIAPQPWRAKLYAWPDRRHLVAVIQTMTGTYHQIVGERRLAVYDMRSGRQLASKPYTRHGNSRVLGTADGKVVILWSPSNPGGRSMQVDLVGVDASVRTIPLDEGRTRGAVRLPAALLDAFHHRVLLAIPGGPIEEVDLSTGRITRHPGVPLAVKPTTLGLPPGSSRRRPHPRVHGRGLEHAAPHPVRDAGRVSCSSIPAAGRSGSSTATRRASPSSQASWWPTTNRASPRTPRPERASGTGTAARSSAPPPRARCCSSTRRSLWEDPRTLGEPFDEPILDPATGKRIGSFHVPGRADGRSVTPLYPTIPSYR